MRSEQSIEIERPVGEVFDFTVNHVAEWSLIVAEDEVIEEKHGFVGSRFRVVTEDRGRRMEFAGVVTGHEASVFHAVEMKGRQFDIDVSYRFGDLGGRTRVTQCSIVRPRGLFKVMFALFGWLMKKANCDSQVRELENLKRLMEDRAAG